MAALKKFFSSVWGRSLIILIGWNLVVRLIASLGYFLLPERYAPLPFIGTWWQSNFLFWSFANFDGEHYLSIAKFGYQIRNGFPQYAFFPLVPLLIQGVSSIVRDIYLAGYIVTQGALWIALVYVHKWSELLHLKDIRLVLLLSPFAIFLSAIYTEPVFLALAALALYYSEKKWWGRVALSVALATATRINGVFLMLFMLMKMWQSKVKVQQIVKFALLGVGGILGYMVYLWTQTGDALAWYHAQHAWGKDVATSPLVTMLNYLRAISIEFKPDLTHLVVVIEVATTLITLTLLGIMIKRRLLSAPYWAYLGANLALPIATGSLGSMPRFYATLFPLLVCVTILPGRSKTLYYVYSLLASTVGIILFTRGYWYG